MEKKKDRTNLIILIAALLAAAVLGYYLPTKRGEGGSALAPKQQMDLNELKKAQRERFGGDS
jgi:hypothetical protein